MEVSDPHGAGRCLVSVRGTGRARARRPPGAEAVRFRGGAGLQFVVSSSWGSARRGPSPGRPSATKSGCSSRGAASSFAGWLLGGHSRRHEDIRPTAPRRALHGGPLRDTRSSRAGETSRVSEWPLLADADALLPTPRANGITGRGPCAAAPRLLLVASHSVGVRSRRPRRVRARGILVTNTPDVLTDATADLAWALILAVARRLHEARRSRAPERGTGGSRRSSSVSPSRAGRSESTAWAAFGRAVARRGEAFGMTSISFEKERNRRGIQEIPLESGCVVRSRAPHGRDSRPVWRRGARSAASRAILVNTARARS